MKVTYYDATRQVRVDDNPNLLRGLDDAVRKYACPYCSPGGITVQKVGSCYRLWCPRCGELHNVASKYASKSSRIFAVHESARKSESDLFGGE